MPRMARPKPVAFDKKKVVAENRRARFDYAVETVYEAGLVLTGTEVKSLRFGEGSIAESYADIQDGAVLLINANIPEFSHGNRFNHEAKRPRKLLLHEREVNKLHGAVAREGMTLVPPSIPPRAAGPWGRGRAPWAARPPTSARTSRSASGKRKREGCCVSAADPALTAGGGVGGWVRRHVPTREAIEGNRWLRPVAHHILKPSLWRFNRRSVPRAAAVGAACTVLFPFAHMPIAALASVPARANVPLAVAITVPGTFVFGPIWYLALQVGRVILQVDRDVPGRPIATNVPAHAGTLHWLAQGGPAMMVGLLVLAPVLAAMAYALAAAIWRVRIARQWRNRSRNRRTRKA